MGWNQCPASVGFSVQHGSDYAILKGHFVVDSFLLVHERLNEAYREETCLLKSKLFIVS